MHRRFRLPGSEAPGISLFNIVARSAIPDGELQALVASTADALGQAITLCPAPAWAVEVSVLNGIPADLLACCAWQPDPESTETLVTIIASERSEPAIILCLGSSLGLRLCLEHRITGAAAPLRATMWADMQEVHAHLTRACFPTGLIEWNAVAREARHLLLGGIVNVSPTVERTMLEAGGSQQDPVVAISHRLVNALTRCEQFPRRATPFPSLHASWFRMADPPAERGIVELDLVMSDLETRALGVALHLHGIPVGEFLQDDDAYEELTPAIVDSIARHGVDIALLKPPAARPEGPGYV